ncbi:ribonuclease YeeF family protein [Rossellomorea vietnamensis]|uniref:ribonuclease YeeF family protein n=1 Tax=Rossellomorea vietnamensis TaxID=218284 RepID=UPI00077C3BFC|nr:T7SS effector LXG polymorphic toxin [Rossellomorea vietnamensis]
MKILDVDGFQHGIKEIEETLSSQKDQVEQIERAVQDVVNLDEAFKGEGGNAIRDFYRSQHLPMLEQYQLFLSDYQSVIRQMKEALDHVEPSPDGFIRQSFLDNEVEEGLHRARRTTVELTGEANATIRSVSDIVSVPRIQDWSFLQQVTHAQEEKEHSLRKLYEFDHTQTASLAPLEEQVHTMTQQIARLQTVFQKGKLGIIEKKAHQEDSSFLSKLSEFTSVMAKNKVSEFLGTVEGALFAIVDIVSDLVDTLIALFTDPIGFFKGIIHTVLHPIDTAKYIWKDLKQSFEEEVVNGDVRSRARYFSYAGTYIAASIFGAKGVDKVGKMGKAGKMSSKTDIPYNVMTTAKIKSFIHNGVKSTFGKVEDTAHQLLSSRTGKRALGLNSFSGHLQELFRKTKNVLNPKKVKLVMEKTYQKVVAGPVSRVAQSEAFSKMGKVLVNEDGHVVVSGKDRNRLIETKGKVKIDYDLAKDYIRDVEAKTGLKLHKSQINNIKSTLRENVYNKMTPLETLKHRNKFNSLKNKLINEWEEETGQVWPRYTEEIYDRKGRLLRDIGQPYDAHHIIENNFGGPHEWWNIHPAKFPDEHQAGIHGKGSPSNKLFPRR